MRSATVRELSTDRLGWSGPLEEGWERTYYTYTDFKGFMSQLTPRAPYRPDEYARVAREVFEDQVHLKVLYLELSFDVPTRQVGDDLRFWPIVEALEEERRRAEERWPIKINYIAGLMRTLAPEVVRYRVELVAEARNRGIAIVGVDLHGDELAAPAAEFADAYRLARERGFGLRVHAGEAVGPESVWEALDILGAHRIAHGFRAIEDPQLMVRLRRRDVTLEICPTSNVRTAVVPTLKDHPVRMLYDLGIPITVGADDPLPFFTDINREYQLLVEEFGFDREDLRLINVYAAKAAFLDDEQRQALIARINHAYRDAAHGVAEPAS